MSSEAFARARERQARRAGVVPYSPLLAQAIGLVAVASIAESLATAAAGAVHLRVVQALRSAAPHEAWRLALSDAVALAAPALLAVLSAVLLCGLLQTRGLLALQRLFSSGEPEGLVDGGRAPSFDGLPRAASRLGAAIVLAVCATVVLLGSRAQILDSIGSASAASKALLGGGRALLWTGALCGAALGVADLALAHGLWRRRLRLPAHEARRLLEQEQGRTAHREARARARRELLTGDPHDWLGELAVLIVWPGQLAVGIRLQAESDAHLTAAPVIGLRESGASARRAEQAARLLGLGVHRDEMLAVRLQRCGGGEQVPGSEYAAVARALLVARSALPALETLSAAQPERSPRRAPSARRLLAR